VNLFVDTSAWSLALRRDTTQDTPVVARLRAAVDAGDALFTTGLVLQELLQGFHGARARAAIIERFAALPLVTPDRNDHIAAAELRTHCRQRGVQVATIDALLAALCIRHDLTMLTADADFGHIARHSDLRVWAP
jgi:predicted nucleic acid-binding protein